MIQLNKTYNRPFFTEDGGALANPSEMTGTVYRNGSLESGVAVTFDTMFTGFHFASLTSLGPTDGWRESDDLVVLVAATISGTTYYDYVMDSVAYMGSVPIVALGESIPRTTPFQIELFLGEIGVNTIQVQERVNGVLRPKDLSGIASLSLTLVDNATKATVQTVANGSLVRTDDANGNVGFTNSADVTSTERALSGFLWNDAGPTVVLPGTVTVKYAKKG